MGARARPARVRTRDRARRAGARRDAEDIDPPLSTLEGRRLEGAERRAKNLLFPIEDSELVLRVHLMSAGRIRYLAPGAKGPKKPMFRLRFSNGGELILTEGGKKKRAGVWLTTIRPARGGSRAPRPGCARAGCSIARRDPEPRAPPAPPAPPRPARPRGNRAGARQRDSPQGSAEPVQGLDGAHVGGNGAAFVGDP